MGEKVITITQTHNNYGGFAKEAVQSDATQSGIVTVSESSALSPSTSQFAFPLSPMFVTESLKVASETCRADTVFIPMHMSCMPSKNEL